MSTTTTNLGLFEYDPVADANQTYNITNALNNNFDIIDGATGKLSNLTTTEQGSLVGAINEIVSSIPDTSGLATKDLDNLSATGKTKVVTLAHELDYTNAIEVSTTNSHTYQSYTATADGILVAFAYGTANVGARIRNADGTRDLSQVYMPNQVGYLTTWFPILKGETLQFEIYGTGGTPNVSCNFIPFKKS